MYLLKDCLLVTADVGVAGLVTGAVGLSGPAVVVVVVPVVVVVVAEPGQV